MYKFIEYSSPLFEELKKKYGNYVCNYENGEPKLSIVDNYHQLTPVSFEDTLLYLIDINRDNTQIFQKHPIGDKYRNITIENACYVGKNKTLYTPEKVSFDELDEHIDELLKIANSDDNIIVKKCKQLLYSYKHQLYYRVNSSVYELYYTGCNKTNLRNSIRFIIRS